MKSMKNDNRGVTLVEVILGVVILGIIVVPLLHTFVVGAHSSRKSAQLAAVTTAAENVIEKTEATDVPALMSNASLLGSGAAFCIKTPDGSFTTAGVSAPNSIDKIYYIKIPSVNSGNGDYSALVTLNGNTDANNQPIGVSNQMDAVISMTGYDEIALSEFIAECTEVDKKGNIVYSPTLSDLTRNINVTVTSQNRSESAKTADYNLEVAVTYRCTAKGFFRSYSSPAIVTQVKDTEFGKAAFSMFLFYDAYYKAGGYTETIEIQNPYKAYMDFNIFIVNTDTGAAPYGYKAQIEYKNQRYNGSQTYSRVFTNLPQGHISYKAYRDGIWCKTMPVSGYLVEEKPSDRRYLVNIQIFDKNEGITGSPLISLDAEKLD